MSKQTKYQNAFLKMLLGIFTVVLLFIFPRAVIAQNCCNVATDCPIVSGYIASCNMHNPACSAFECSYSPGSGTPSSINWSILEAITLPNFAGGTIGSVISGLLPYIFGLVGFLILLYLVWGGYDVLTSMGEPKRMAQGREKITYAIVGFIVMFVAYWILQLVGRILGIQQLVDIFG